MVKLVRHADVCLRVQSCQREARSDVLYDMNCTMQSPVCRVSKVGRLARFSLMRTVKSER